MTDGDGSEMRDVAHTHPHTGETFGAVYRRGPAATDGGRPPSDGDGGDAADGEAGGDPVMADVDHTPPHGDGASGVWERGAGDGPAPRGADVAADGEGTDATDERTPGYEDRTPGTERRGTEETEENDE